MEASAIIKAKKSCCKSRPRCKRCPVVLRRLAEQDLVERVQGRRYQVLPGLRKKHFKAARKR